MITSEWLQNFESLFKSFDIEVDINTISKKYESFQISDYYNKSQCQLNQEYLDKALKITDNFFENLPNETKSCCPKTLAKKFIELFGEPVFYEKLFLAKTLKNSNPLEFASIRFALSDIGLDFKETDKSSIGKINKQVDEKVDYGSFYNLISAYISVDNAVCNFITAEKFRLTVSLHVIRHFLSYEIFKKKFKELEQTLSIKNGNQNDTLVKKRKLDYRNEGWCSCRVLIMTSTRAFAKEWVNYLSSLLNEKIDDKKLLRILKKYSTFDENDEIDIATELGWSMVDTRSKKMKPFDYIYSFRGNNDDNFVLPLKIKKKKIIACKNLSSADLIIASPLGIRLALAKNQEKYNSNDSDRESIDSEEHFKEKNDSEMNLLPLSSLEIMIVDNYHILVQQNISHLYKIFESINRKPYRAPNVNISRLRSCHLNDTDEDLSKYLRQDIFMGDGRNMNIFSLPKTNIRGYITLWRARNESLFEDLNNKYKNNFLLYDTCNKLNSTLAMNNNFPYKLEDPLMIAFFVHFVTAFHQNYINEQIAVIVPTYVEYVQVKQLLKVGLTTTNFLTLTERSSTKKVVNVRNALKNGQCSILLTTERFLMYYRVSIIGQVHTIFVQPPKNSLIFYELVCDTNKAPKAVGQEKIKSLQPIILIYWNSRTNIVELERIIGLKKVNAILNKTTAGEVVKLNCY